MNTLVVFHLPNTNIEFRRAISHFPDVEDLLHMIQHIEENEFIPIVCLPDREEWIIKSISSI